MNADRTQMNVERRTEEELAKVTEAILGCAFRVLNALGTGFLEKVYENALAHEFRKAGIAFRQQARVQVQYDGVVVGDYLPDFIVEGEVVLELKVAKSIDPSHVCQCINALRATGYRVGLVLNFGNSRLQVKRLVHNL